MLPVELAGCSQLPSVGAMGAPIESSQTWDLPPIFGWEHPTFQLNILGAPSNSSNGWEHPEIFGGSTGSSHDVMEASRWQIGSSQNIFSIEFISEFHYFLIWSQWVVDICCSATGNGCFCCQSRKAMSPLPWIHFFPHLSQKVFCSLGIKMFMKRISKSAGRTVQPKLSA
jgi:hypothetical protein